MVAMMMDNEGGERESNGYGVGKAKGHRCSISDSQALGWESNGMKKKGGLAHMPST